MQQLEFNLLLLYLNIHKKNRHLTFFRFFHKCLFLIPLWHEIDNATFYFLISSKKSKQHFHTDIFWNYLLLEAEATGTDGRPFSDKRPLIGCLAVIIWRQSTKFCVKEMKEKSVIFRFLKLKAKRKEKFFQIIEGE